MLKSSHPSTPAAKIGIRLDYTKTLYVFADCLGAQATIDETITACRGAIHEARELGGQNHLFLQKLQKIQRQLMTEKDLTRSWSLGPERSAICRRITNAKTERA